MTLVSWKASVATGYQVCEHCGLNALLLQMLFLKPVFIAKVIIANFDVLAMSMYINKLC